MTEDGSIAGECCCSEPVEPASCTPGEFTGTYRLVGYSDGDLTACSVCVDDTSTPWDGTIPYEFSCTWGNYSWPASISGKEFAFAYINFATDRWLLQISCANDNSDPEFIWLGEKLTGDNPAGTYNRTSGCDNTSTLEIEAIP